MAKKTSSRTSKTPEDKPSQTEDLDAVTDATEDSIVNTTQDTPAETTTETPNIGKEVDTDPSEQDPAQEGDAESGEAPGPKDDSDTTTGEETFKDTSTTPAEDISPETAPDTRPIIQEKTVVQKASPFPLVLGGLAAGAVGFAAAMFGLDNGSTTRDQLRKQLDEQSQLISALTEQVDGLPQVPDMSPLESGLTELQTALDQVSGQLEATATNLQDIEERLTAVEKQPVTGGASEAAVAAYERELDALRATMAQERAEIEAMIEAARTAEDTADDAAEAAMRRAAVTRIQTALDTGASFAAAIADLEQTGVDVPGVLSTVAGSGVASLSALQEAFPDAARAALATSRNVTAEAGENSGFTAFLRSQLGARSLEPREGNDPDAVLSRAEAAIRDGRLNDALAEIESLPEEGRAELSTWSSQVTQRLEAVSAAQELSETLN